MRMELIEQAVRKSCLYILGAENREILRGEQREQNIRLQPSVLVLPFLLYIWMFEQRWK